MRKTTPPKLRPLKESIYSMMANEHVSSQLIKMEQRKKTESSANNLLQSSTSNHFRSGEVNANDCATSSNHPQEHRNTKPFNSKIKGAHYHKTNNKTNNKAKSRENCHSTSAKHHSLKKGGHQTDRNPSYLLKTLDRLQQTSSNLKSVMETPSERRNLFSKSGSKPKSTQKTSKKKSHPRNHNMTSRLKKAILLSLENSVNQVLYKTDMMSIRYRAVRSKIIEFELHFHQPVASISIVLEKGNVECQSINEEFFNVTAKSIISLLSSVHRINLEKPLLNFPELKISLTGKSSISEENIMVNQTILVPYCWLHLIEPAKERPLGKCHSKLSLRESPSSRIKFKAEIDDLSLRTNTIDQILALFPFQKKHCRSNSGESRFIMASKEFTFSFKITSTRFAIEIQSRMEPNSCKYLEFVETLLLA